MKTTFSPLGKTVTYIDRYDKHLLFPVARKPKRDEIGISEPLPFKGVDIWNSYEVSWLNLQGKPVVAVAEFIFPCDTPFLIESKSFKLYLNSFNQTPFDSMSTVQQLLTTDLAAATKGAVSVTLMPLKNCQQQPLASLAGICLDDLDITCNTYTVEPQFLTVEAVVLKETLYSDLLKSNCLVTGQPDWGSIQISYTGKKINHEGLLRYFISFRNHNEFHEQCVERIFMDIMHYCAPQQLAVYARYTRRGGLDINPFRSTGNEIPENSRLCRQ